MAMNLEAINEWKRFFESTGKNVFDLLESTINVAARYHPDEFFERRDQIAQLLFARQQQPRGVNTDHDDASDSEEEDTTTNSSDFSDHMALRMKEHWTEGCVDFASKKSTCESKPNTDVVIFDSEKCPASGISMGTEDKEPERRHLIRIKFRPKPKKEEQLEKAESQVAMEGSPKNTTHIEEQKQRALEKEKGSETKCDAEVKLPVPHRVPKKSCTKPAEVGIVTGKSSGKSSERKITAEVGNVSRKLSEKCSQRKITAEVGIVSRKFSEKSSQRKITEKTGVMIKEQKSMCSDFEVKLEASKRKLHEAYKQSEDAKQKKKIRMIELKDLPRGGVGCRAVNHIRSNNGKPMNRIRSSWNR